MCLRDAILMMLFKKMTSGYLWKLPFAEIVFQIASRQGSRVDGRACALLRREERCSEAKSLSSRQGEDSRGALKRKVCFHRFYR